MFKERSKQKELLDGLVSKDELILNLKELDTINSLLGGYKISTQLIKKLNLNNKTVVDIGSGGGDMLFKLYKASPNNTFYGVDLKSDCINYAKEHLPSSPRIKFICSDYRDLKQHITQVDVLHGCLFTHHLDNEEIVQLIRFAKEQKAILVLNDLHRNALAYYSIKLLTRLFSKSRLVKHDAPLSVLRGFKKQEWYQMLRKAGATSYTVKWKWAFRHLIVVYG
jgi:2-polyprenyl-3-methyl-5-hydroxy-6-metoxy-1,4-benzoquinol methylase